MPKEKQNLKYLQSINDLLRHWIVTMTTAAGSGHPTSSLSSVELMGTLFFDGYFKFDAKNPDRPDNDRIIFSKGHASPLFYALWAAANEMDAEELLTLRQFWSRLEGHPTMHFPFTEAATGALGQGLSIGVGMALAAKNLDKTNARTWVLLGDSEMAEGQVWEAMALASHYNLHNLVAIVDVNRLGQRGETMLGRDVEKYVRRAESFGWNVESVEGHHIDYIRGAYDRVLEERERPTMIIAQTVKGRGVSFLEDEDGWHGRALSDKELSRALREIGVVDTTLRAKISLPENIALDGDMINIADSTPVEDHRDAQTLNIGQNVAVRDMYGDSLVDLMQIHEKVVVLDAEVSNSTRADLARDVFPERFFEMFIAEQNMVSVAVGLARRGYQPYISTFAAFFARAHGQIRMARLSDVNMVFVGSHPGVSIGADGSSQMGLEDLAIFRAILDSVVMYPSDAVSARALMTISLPEKTILYIRSTREKTPVLYAEAEDFPIGGSKVLCTGPDDMVTVIAAGITVHEALRAYNILKEENIAIRVIDAYSIKPIDAIGIIKAAADTEALLVVEDHYAEGGLGDAVRSALDHTSVTIHHLAVRKMPRSGTAEELRAYVQIDADAIVQTVYKMVK